MTPCNPVSGHPGAHDGVGERGCFVPTAPAPPSPPVMTLFRRSHDASTVVR
jgi:hypothetical protein